MRTATRIPGGPQYTLLGGYYGLEALLPVVKIDFHTDFIREEKGGLGDLILSPFIIQWVDHEILGMPFFHRINFPFILPTGRYESDVAVNIGSNVYSFNPYYAFTVFLTPKLETSWRFNYLWNSENNDPHRSFDAGSIQPGQAFHLNYAFSYEVLNGLRIGFAGYYLNQITSDKLDGDKRPNSKERVFSIGPGAMFSKDGFFCYANVFFERDAENRAEGMKFSLRLSKVF